MNPAPEETALDAALDAIIRGETVRRGRHALGGASERFHARLVANGFRETRVGEVDPGPESRVPAFLVRDDEAIFGYIFEEKFTETRCRRLFGSVERNAKGDWAVMLGISSRRPIYAAPQLAVSYDGDHPD